MRTSERFKNALVDFPDIDGIPITFTRDELRIMLMLCQSVEQLCNEAESYIDIGFDTDNESVRLREAVRIVRETLYE